MEKVPITVVGAGVIGLAVAYELSKSYREILLLEKNPDYAVDSKKQTAFFESVRTFLPFIEKDDLAMDMAGIRPKLQGPNEGFRDFIITEESGNGVPGLINLIGIESPGLTSCLSIAKMVDKIVKKFLDKIFFSFIISTL
jgi:L-2-hydroxyglutarate oxidase LhgO